MDSQQQCEQCSPLPASCPQPSCPIPEFTAECTDECLVLTCDDPDHGTQTCLVTSGSTPCDGTCITAAACDDCPGLDEILQCCTDYHSYFSLPKSQDPSQLIPWNRSLSDLPCDCTQDLQSMYASSSVSRSSIQALFSDPSISSSASSSPPLTPFSPHPHPSSPLPVQTSSTQSFNCMWANCNSVFSSLSSLVGHVNLQHLCAIDPPNHPSTLSLHPQNDQRILSQLPLSCHWRDCATFPSSASIPSSSASSDDHILNVLATHLMQDHLGVNYPFPASTSVLPRLPEVHDTSDAARSSPTSPGSPHICASPPPISPDSSSHDCSGTHPCKWKACAQTFTSCDELTAHIASIHIGGGKAHYECFWEDCNRHGSNGFSSKQKISRHLQSHTGHRPFQCQVCNLCFSEAATLQQHMRRHTKERPYICDFPGCAKAFAITGALTIHKRTHNGSRPFKCNFCDRAFSESSNLTKHLRTHTGVRPYVCSEEGCKKAFARPDQLARHMNVHRKNGSKG